jgi:hypothetical protein
MIATSFKQFLSFCMAGLRLQEAYRNPMPLEPDDARPMKASSPHSIRPF